MYISNRACSKVRFHDRLTFSSRIRGNVFDFADTIRRNEKYAR